MRRLFHIAVIAAMAAVLMSTVGFSARPVKKSAVPEYDKLLGDIDGSVRKGLAYLEKAIHPDGSYGVEFKTEDGKTIYSPNVGIAGLVALAALESPYAKEEREKDYFKKTIKYLLSKVQKDGSISTPKSGYYTYKTAICLKVFTLLDKEKYAKVIKNGQDFLRNTQYDEHDKMTAESDYFGGWGYGQKLGRASLPPVSWAIEGLKESGVKADDPVMKKAKVFVDKCQNTDQNPYDNKNKDKVENINDGGARHNPLGSKVESTCKTPGKVNFPSYGSMTAAFIKSLIHMGVPRDDMRLRRAFKWVVDNYSLDKNPGFSSANNKDQQGLYFYYQTMSKALRLFGVHVFATKDGKLHNWSAELAQKIVSLQRKDSSWLNQYEERWIEGNPVLVTAYCLLALSNCRRDLQSQKAFLANVMTRLAELEKRLADIPLNVQSGEMSGEEAQKLLKEIGEEVATLASKSSRIRSTIWIK